MNYAHLPFTVPGVTGPMPAPSGAAVAEDSPAAPQPAPARETACAAAATPAATATAPAAALVDPEWLLAGRPREQRAAIVHRGGPLILEAGPGAGKTATLTRRIAYLLASGQAQPHQILAVTFTIRAADEMRVRLIDLLGVERARSLTVCTFHALCQRLIRAHAGRVGRRADYSIHDQGTVARIARTILADPDRQLLAAHLELAGDVALKDVLGQISLAKNQLLTPEEYARTAPGPHSELTAELWRAIDSELLASNSVDLDDLLVYCVQLLRDDRLARYYRDRYRHLLVDEFQDTNAAQMEIVRRLTAPDGNVTVIGDVDQAVYAFRGARPRNMLDFHLDFPAVTTITLAANFRSRSEILDAAGRCVSHNTARTPKTLIAQRGGGGRVQVTVYATEDDEARAVADRVQDELERGRAPREIVALCRNGFPLRPLQARLQERGVRVRLVGGMSLWERSEVRDALAYLTLVANPYDAAAFERAICAPADRKPFAAGNVKAPTRGTGEKGVALIVAFARAQQSDLISAALRCAEIPGLRRGAREAVLVLAGALERIRRRAWETAAGGLSISDLVTQTLMITGGVVETYQMLRDQAHEPGVREDANRVLEDLRSLRNAAIVYEDAAPDGFPTLSGFLAMLGVDDAEELDAEHDDRVTLSTIHGAKGTEAEVVILIGVEQGLLPGYRALESATRDGLEEERRLFYVALTRAKDELLITHTHVRRGRPTNGPSLFLAEAGLS